MAHLRAQGLLLFAFDEGIYSTESTGQEGAVYWIIRAIVFVVIYIGLLVLLYAYPPTEVSASLSETKRAFSLEVPNAFRIQVHSPRWWYPPGYWWYGTKIFHTYCWVMLFFSAFELLGWILILVQIDAGEWYDDRIAGIDLGPLIVVSSPLLSSA